MLKDGFKPKSTMLGQQSQAQLITQRQNNGNQTLRPIGTMVERQLRPGSDQPEHGRPSDAELAAKPVLASHYAGWYTQKNRGFLVSLVGLIGFFLAIPVFLASAYEIELFLNTQYGLADLYAFGVMAVSTIAAPWLIRLIYRKGVNLQHHASLWSISFKLVAFIVVAGVTAYYSMTWTWVFIDYFELAVAQQDRLYWGISWALSAYLAFIDTV